MSIEETRIYVTKPSLPPIEEYLEEIRPIWESKILTNMGPLHEIFASRLEDYLDVPNIALFTNGHAALEMAIEALGLRNTGGEVITTPFTFISTTHAIVRSGLTPVFCDIKKDDCTIDPTKIETLITDKTVAIMPVHVYGNVCDVEAIDEIAKKYNLKIIYDAAHAFGVKYKGKGIGNYGDAAVFSFHATKVFNTIEGGAVAFKDDRYKDVLFNLKNHGIKSETEIEAVGSNAKMDEFRAAMGICNLRHVQDYITKRKVIYEFYLDNLKEVNGIEILNASSCCGKDISSLNYGYMPIRILPEKRGVSRDDIYEALIRKNIYARKYFYPLTNLVDCYLKEYGNADVPLAKKISKEVLSLPIYPDIQESIVCEICRTIKDL